MEKTCLILAAIAALTVALVYAYEQGWLNQFLPASWQKQHFVGAYGRTLGMQNCLAFGDAGKRWPHFNRCTWV
jgi:uncharacterized membrane protein YedE/YeeE